LKAAVLYKPGDLRIEDVEKPKIGYREVLVKVKACTICPTDVKKYRGVSTAPLPLITGHEFSGIIEEVAEDVEEVKKGDEVVVSPTIRCGKCYYCKAGLPYCLSTEVIGHSINGAFAEYTGVPVKQIYKKPENLSFKEAAITEPVAACVKTVRVADVSIAENVVIIGAGFMGLTFTQLCKLRGSNVIVSEISDERRELASKLGADEVINPKNKNPVIKVKKITNGRGADVVICAVGNKPVIEQGIQMLGLGGRILLFASAFPPQKVEVDPNLLHYKQQKIIGIVSFTEYDFSKSLELLSNKKLDTNALITYELPLDETEKAFKMSINLEGIKNVIIP
jgi:L-iditol 2-dehydrogenase